MLRKNHRAYWKNKLINSIRIKKYIKLVLLKSLRNSKNVPNLLRLASSCKLATLANLTTSIVDVCLGTSLYKKSNKSHNFSRYEFHRLCRTNKLTGRIIHSW